MNQIVDFTINPLVAYLGKEPKEFRKADIINFVVGNEIRIIDFRYAANDGRLKTLSFPVSSSAYLDSILSYGERVDGSSLFPFIEAGSSDLYVVPRYCTAYLDPFAELPTLGLLCSYFTKDGAPLETSPQYTLEKAHRVFHAQTGLTFEAMGELEFYVIDQAHDLFVAENQRGYHESAPYSKFYTFRNKAMDMIARAGCQIKYAHSEVGNFTLDGKVYEQNEIEFLVDSVQSAADQLLMAKWILRTLAWKQGLDLTFAPKITEGKAGSGMHFHTRLLKNGKPVMTDEGGLSEEARKAIAGYMTCAASLTAFGNTNPCSYFRLVPHQEAPTSICWGDRNRSVLVRVPLGWKAKTNMAATVNPLEPQELQDIPDKQTVEMRSPDCSADVYLMLAGLVNAAKTGFETENALEIAEKTYVDVNIHDSRNKAKMEALAQLPASCYESAQALKNNRAIYEADGVFHPALIDGVIAKLEAFNDKDIRREIKEKPERMMELVRKFYQCG
jgi:glutamine synthetase